MKLLKRGGGETKPKAKKRKNRGSTGNNTAAMKELFANHVEKLLLAGIGLMSLYLVYSGFKQEGLGSDKSPEQITVAINNANNHIKQPSWDQVRQLRHPEPDRFDSQAELDTIDIDPADFEMAMPLHPVLQKRQKQRIDPRLIAVEEVEARPGYGPIYLNETGDGGGFESLRSRDNDDSRAIPDELRQRMRGEATSSANTEGRYFVAVTGLIPVRKQLDIYLEAFRDAVDYVPERDQPIYLAQYVERREIGADGQPTNWVDLDAINTIKQQVDTWERTVEEVAQEDYIIKGGDSGVRVNYLVMPLPPLANRDVAKWALHSKVPARLDEESLRAEERRSMEREDVGDDIFDDGLRTHAAEDRSEQQQEEFLDEDVTELLKADYALVRFFDFTAEPGKEYQYRIRLLLDDPNNPRENRPPPSNACTSEVLIRRQEAKLPYRQSEWSAPSATVQVSAGRSVFAGSVVPARGRADEPEANVMAVVWDAEKAMDVPVEVTVKRGAVINGTVETEAIDPSRMRIVKLSEYRLNTNSLVVDIAGGQRLDSNLLSPGRILLMDSNGNLVARHEMSDLDRYQDNVLPPDPEEERQKKELERQREEEERREGRRGRRGRGEETQEEQRFADEDF